VDRALVGHRLCGRRQRLTQHLTAEHRAPAQVLALTPEQVGLDLLEREQLDELLQDFAHGAGA
jgi:hypothetical protein